MNNYNEQFESLDKYIEYNESKLSSNFWLGFEGLKNLRKYNRQRNKTCSLFTLRCIWTMLSVIVAPALLFTLLTNIPLINENGLAPFVFLLNIPLFFLYGFSPNMHHISAYYQTIAEYMLRQLKEASEQSQLNREMFKEYYANLKELRTEHQSLRESYTELEKLNKELKKQVRELKKQLK